MIKSSLGKTINRDTSSNLLIVIVNNIFVRLSLLTVLTALFGITYFYQFELEPTVYLITFVDYPLFKCYITIFVYKIYK